MNKNWEVEKLDSLYWAQNRLFAFPFAHDFHGVHFTQFQSFSSQKRFPAEKIANFEELSLPVPNFEDISQY